MKRKVACVILILVMCLGQSISALAATTIDVNGKTISAPEGCEIVTDGVVVSEGMIIIRNGNYYSTDSKYGVMNTDGTVIVPLIYDRIYEFSEGLAAVYESHPYQYELYGMTYHEAINKIGFIDKAGNLVIPMIYEDIHSTTFIMDDFLTGLSSGSIKSPGFSEGLLSVKKEGKWGVIDTLGNTVIPFKDDGPVGSFHNGLASFASGRKYGFMNSRGEVVIPPQYDHVSDFTEGYAIVGNYTSAGQYEDMLYGAIDTQGNLVVPMQYEYMSRFREGMACVSNQPVTGKYGFVNTSGNLIVPMQYSEAYVFSNGLAAVAVRDDSTRQDKYGYIDKQGNVVVPLEHSWESLFQ